MKKFSLYMIALLSAVFTGCSDNYDPEVGPQSNQQESPVKVSDVSVTNTVEAIDLTQLINETTHSETPIAFGKATAKEGALPANTVLKAEVEVSNTEDFAKSATVSTTMNDTTNVFSVSPTELEDAWFNNITKNPSTTKMYYRTILYTVTKDDAAARIGQPGVDFFSPSNTTLTPLNKVTIAKAYYIVGGPNDWKESAVNRSIKFTHSDKDVYEDPVFTVTFDANPDGDTWFAIGDDAACEAIANKGDSTQLYGIVGGQNDATEGKIERRAVLGADNSFKVAKGAKKIRVTIDMMEGTFKVEAINFNTVVYFRGATNGWGNGAQKLGLTDEAKGIYTGYVYCADPNGWGNEFKLAKDASDWDKGEYDSKNLTLTGDVTAKDGGNIVAAKGVGLYYLELDAVNMTLKATKITNMNLVGSFNGWNQADKAQRMTWDAEHYCFVMTNAGVNAAGWKFTANDEWVINLGANDTTEPSSKVGDLVPGGKNLNVVGKTIKLYPCRTNTDKIYATVE
jgi:hypothetical protein